MTTTISGTAGVTFPAGGVGNPAGAVISIQRRRRKNTNI